MSRRSATRTLAGVGVSLASLAIGIVGARAISGTDDSAATSSAAPVDGAAPVLLDPADAAVTVDDGLWSVAMGAAAHRSIDEGRPVTLAEMGLPADLLGP